MTHSKDLNSIFVQIWIELDQGVQAARHPFHTPALATVDETSPNVRTVVLRQADATTRQLVCHTDIRAPKVAQMRARPEVAWLFYHAANKVQLRMLGSVRVHHEDAVANARWREATPRSRQCYAARLAPGADAEASPARPAGGGFGNFAVIRCDVTSIDWLFLRGRGHLRARFDWTGGAWQGRWIAP